MLNQLSKILIFGLFVTSGGAYGADICDTLVQCPQLRSHHTNTQTTAQIDTRIQVVDTTTQLGDILKNADGSIKYMTYDQAMVACPSGSHLPTIRELAKESQALGAKGIIEMSQDNRTTVPDGGYYYVGAINPDKTKDEFYFGYGGYQRPEGDLGSNIFWSSSIVAYRSDDTDEFYANHVYDLFGDDGYIGSVHRSDPQHAVRCMRDK